MRRLLLLLGPLAACAKMQAPPGGPPDNRPPGLVAAEPDSLRSLPGFDGSVEFRFDEVVSEGGQPNFGLGTGDLEKLVVLSPSKEVPVVRWHRDRITVKPREGWQPNTVYRVELLAGVRDLRNNQSRDRTIVTFTTGTELPSDSLRGRVVDWTTAQPVRAALVEAVILPDSQVYRTQSDSAGFFRLGPLPRSPYVVYGVVDQNRNGRRELRELFDSVSVAAGQDSVGELWAFRHDSAGPRIQQISRGDSLTASITFTGHLDPTQRFAADSVVVRLLPDSTAVAIDTLLPQPAMDSLVRTRRDTAQARDSTRADTTGARRDTAAVRRDSVPAADTTARRIPGVPRRIVGARQPPRDTTDRSPLTTRPRLYDRLILRMRSPWTPGARYVVEIFGLRTASGVAGPVRGVLVVPEPQAAPARPDSGRARADTTRRPPDSSATRRPPG